jgi:hypothetical protein
MFDAVYAVIIIPVKGGQTTAQAIGNTQTYRKAKFIAEMEPDGNVRITHNITGQLGEMDIERLLVQIRKVLEANPLTF